MIGDCARGVTNFEDNRASGNHASGRLALQKLFCLFVKLSFPFTTADLCPAVPSTLCLQSRCKVDC